MNRIRSIDGLRALSILMVLLGHGMETMPPALTNNYFFAVIGNSGVGVNIFFVISGYLITKLLMIEKDKKGEVSLKHFYLRRAFRIFPLFYLYLLVILALKIWAIPDIVNSYRAFFFAGAFLWNSILVLGYNPGPKGTWFLGHFWTLAMEEQFYLVWPLMFTWIGNRVTLTKVVLVIIIIMPFVRVLTYFLIPVARPQLGLMLVTGGDAILFGCSGALIEAQKNFREKYLPYIQNNFFVVFAVIFILVLNPLLMYYLKGGYSLLLGLTLNNAAILLFVFWSMYTNTAFSRLLNNKALMWIGVLSYSIYIWQQLFLTPKIDIWFNKFPQNLVVVFVVAWLSYTLVEKPILALKKRFKDI